MITYESNLERNWLTLLDFAPDITGISSQPLRLHGPVGDDWLDHVPDFFVRLQDGNGRLIDVSHPVRADSDRVTSQAALTRRCAELIGWDYQQLREPQAQRWANVSWLAGYRRPLPISEGLLERLLDLASKPVALKQLVAFTDEPLLARPAVFHLCWHQRLVFDLDRPLNDDTPLTATERS